MGASPGALTVDFSTTPSSSRSNRGLHLFLPHPIPHHPRTFGASQGIRREPNPPRQKKRRDLRAAAAVLHPHAPGFGAVPGPRIPAAAAARIRRSQIQEGAFAPPPPSSLPGSPLVAHSAVLLAAPACSSGGLIPCGCFLSGFFRWRTRAEGRI